MINAEFMSKAIDKVLERFEKDDYLQRCYEEEVHEGDEIFDVTFYIEDEISFLLRGLHLEYDVELVDAFECPSCEIWVLCIAYVVDGKLYTNNVVVELH